MGSFSSDGEEYQFFDANENVALMSDSGSDYPECPDYSSGVDYGVSCSFQYDLWNKSPGSVQERRSEFFRIMGICLEDRIEGDSVYGDVFKCEIDRIMDSSGAVSRSPIFEDEFSSSRSSMSSWSDSASDMSRGSGLRENVIGRIGNSDGGTEYIVDELGHDGKLNKLRVVGEDQFVTAEEYENTSRLSPSVQQFVQREIDFVGNMARMMNRVKKWRLSRLRSMACIMDRQAKSDKLRRVQRVVVHHCRKQLKELSALFRGQDIKAHEGSILTMKFSFDGQYLASAGEDGIVRVWQVVEDERSNEIDIPDFDLSCIYFTVNKLSELAPLMAEKDRISKLKSMRKTADSVCVIFPPKVFRILEKPLHEFHGHSGEILDLSWSKKTNCLLSSSVDKSVRLWQVGCDQCLKVFPHSNYVTCVQFNPVEDYCFISGSIDGKVRIWAINGCLVVDWTDIREIVTAVSYRPDGQGGIIGSITGNIHLFSVSDNHFQQEGQMCLNGKKKSPYKRVTGFEFFPQDPSKVLVTCADSQVRILHGINVIGKYRGQRSSGNQISAFFTSDGKHIVSACEDSNVYVWNCISLEESSSSEPKTIRSFECFSIDASVAIPWPGLKLGNSKNGRHLHALNDSSPYTLPCSSSACFSLGQEFFSIPKGSATWPEEKLPSSNRRAMSSAMCKSQYKFLKTFYESSSSTHAWDLVIVTAGWDGRIRSFHNYGLPVTQ